MDSTNARIINCYQDEFQHWDISNIDDLIEEDVIPEEEVVQQQQEIYQECEVTEEIITDDWVQGEENIIQVTVGDIGGIEVKQEDEIIPLTEEHNEFTLKPYPCDFCHKRFRKKANLHNHMIAHQNDHPYGCKLCGNRYTRKNELHKHLKIHAYNDDGYDDGFSPQIHHMKPVLDISNILSSPSTSKKPQKKAIIQQRIESLDPRKPYVCQICGVTFARPKALDAHMLLHGDMTLDECEKCGEQFWDASAMRKHRRRHIMEEQAKTEQEFDDEATESDIEARGMKDPIYGCTECPRSFNSTTALQHHIQTHLDPMEAEEEPLHCCNVCGEGFDEALDLLAHAEVHARNSAHRCLMCGDSFDQESTLKLHINESHRHELTDTTCRICGRLCKDARSLIRHSWDHSKERSHSCSRCAKTFQNKARLKRHMLSHKNKSVVCDVCHLHFPDGRSLMNHRHSHTKAHQFHCNVCGKSFGSRSSQQIHLRIHTGEKPYSCRFCWKAFADGGTLRKHERIHTGEKPYACAVCPRAFNQRVVLREHIRSHHSAPDIKNGSIYEPYYCTVCGNTFDSSANLVNHLVEHSDHNTQARRQPVVGPRKYKRRRARPEDDTKTTSRKEIEEEIATYNFRKSVPARVKREDFELPHELQPDIGQLTLKHIKEPKVEDIAIKSENFPLLDDGQPLETKMSADFFNESIMKFDPGVVNDLKEILQSPVKERERNDGRPRRSVKPTLKCIESQQQEKDFHKKTNRSTENRCQICGLAFSTRAGLVSHVQVHI